MLDTSARLLRLLSLLQSRPSWAGADLAARLDVTARTVRRDVDRLRQLGYPVAAAPGAGGGYRLGAGAALPPLLLDDDEAVAVVLGLRTSADGSVAGAAEASVRALSKLERVLPGRLRGRVAALQAATVAMPAPAAVVDPDCLVVLATACRTPERVRFGYRDRRGFVSERSVEPLRLVHTGRRWYLVARDVDRADWRTFRVDRIDRPAATGWRFTAVDPPDPVAFVADAVGVAPYRHQARVRLNAPAAVIREQVPATVGVVEVLGPATCELTTGSDSLDAIAVHLAMLGVDFDVLEPPELAARMVVLAARLARAAQETAAVQGESGPDR